MALACFAIGIAGIFLVENSALPYHVLLTGMIIWICATVFYLKTTKTFGWNTLLFSLTTLTALPFLIVLVIILYHLFTEGWWDNT